MDKEIQPGQTDEECAEQSGRTDGFIFDEDRRRRREGSRSVPRREGPAARCLDEQIERKADKGAGTLDDGFDDLVVDEGRERQGKQSGYAEPACFFEDQQNNTENDPNQAAVAERRKQLHDRRQKIGDEVFLYPK